MTVLGKIAFLKAGALDASVFHKKGKLVGNCKGGLRANGKKKVISSIVVSERVALAVVSERRKAVTDREEIVHIYKAVCTFS